MSKVEELRRALLSTNSDYLCWSKSWGTEAIDSLIAAARAEGAAQERGKAPVYSIQPVPPVSRYEVTTSSNTLAPKEGK